MRAPRAFAGLLVLAALSTVAAACAPVASPQPTARVPEAAAPAAPPPAVAPDVTSPPSSVPLPPPTPTPPPAVPPAAAPPPAAPPPIAPPPAPPAIPDAAQADRELAARVERALATDPSLRDVVIEAEAEAGRVTLTGTVPSFRERARAIERALEVPGVKSVRPRLVLQSQ
jgi:hypothetical protein